jgi:SAM-dependent methyltransferase
MNVLTRWLRGLARGYLDQLYRAMRNGRRAAQLAAVTPQSGAHLLDCGCREGQHTRQMADRLLATRVVGLDYNATAISLAAAAGIIALQADLNRSIPLAANSMDVIVASDVIEHLVEPATFVSELFRVLRPGGYLVLDTPNLASWHNVFALVIGEQPFSGPNVTTMEDADIGLVREMHRSTHGLLESGPYIDGGGHELTRHLVVLAYGALLRLLGRSGLVVDWCRGFGYYPLPPPAAAVMQRLDPRHSHHLVLRATKPMSNSLLVRVATDGV